MRPITRGITPLQKFRNYRDAFPLLKERLGPYCSYCERLLETHLAVEHVLPQSTNPHQRFSWNNFLLACTNCNSCKSDQPVAIEDYVWPDRDNTLLFFGYGRGQVRNRLPADDPAFGRVDATIKLFGLHKTPANTQATDRPSDADFRWKFRIDIVDLAQKARQRLAHRDIPELREQIVDTALARGGFSIWFDVFAGDLDMCRRLIEAFPHTAWDCFDNGTPVPKVTTSPASTS